MRDHELNAGSGGVRAFICCKCVERIRQIKRKGEREHYSKVPDSCEQYDQMCCNYNVMILIIMQIRFPQTLIPKYSNTIPDVINFL